MQALRQFLDSVNSGGAHILIATALLLVGFFSWRGGFDGGKELFVAMLGIVAYAMKGGAAAIPPHDEKK